MEIYIGEINLFNGGGFMRKILTIAIPTYNRLEALKKSLTCILSQINFEEVDILVSDNCSTDGTKIYMEKLIDKYPNIRYNRHQENIGADNNFLYCFNNAISQYLWIIGDDDYVSNGSLEIILNALRENPDFMYLNFRKENTSMAKKKIEKYMNIENYLEVIGLDITFVSSLIFNTKYIKLIKKKEKYINTYFMHANIALETFKYGNYFFVLNQHCLNPTPNLKVSYDVYYVWIISLYNLLFSTGKGLGLREDLLLNLYKKWLTEKVIKFIFQYRITCRNNENDWKKKEALSLLKKLDKQLYLLYVIPMRCPYFLIKFIRKTYLLLNLV